MTHIISAATPIKPHELPEVKKGKLDLIADYLDTTDGTWDLYRLNELFGIYLKGWTWLSSASRYVAERTSKVMSILGAGMSLPLFLTSANNVRRSVAQLSLTQALPATDMQKEEKVFQARKKVFIDTVNWGCSLTMVLTFFHDLKLADFAKQLPVINFFFNITSLVADSSECYDEVAKIQHYRSMDKKTEEESQKEWVSCLKVAKCVASIGLAIIGLTALTGLTASVEPLLLVASTTGLTTIWLAAKISSYFYNKSIEASNENTVVQSKHSFNLRYA